MYERTQTEGRGRMEETPGPSTSRQLDEFTAPGDMKQLLERSRARVQYLFSVKLTILGCFEMFARSGAEDRGRPSRIWLQVQGESADVQKAKTFITGLCEPEIEVMESYPNEMHCVFVGSHGMFLNCLIKVTYANISVLETGVLSVRGGLEPVAMAESRIQQFVQLFKSNTLCPKDKETEVKSIFKNFVESRADKYTLDLLLLPSALKEELLGLTMDAPPVDEENIQCIENGLKTEPGIATPSEHEASRRQAGTPVTELTCQLDTVFSCVSETADSSTSHQVERQSVKRRCSENEDRCSKKPFSLEAIQADGLVAQVNDDIPVIDLISNTSDSEDSVILVEEAYVTKETEHKILVNFFKSMGYLEEVVEKVIRAFGPFEEPLKLLEEIEMETTKASSSRVDPVCSTSAGPPIPAVCGATTRAIGTPIPESTPKQALPVEQTLGNGVSSGDVILKPPPVSDNVDCDGVFTKRLEVERGTQSFDFVARGTSNLQHTCGEIFAMPGPSNMPPVNCAGRVLSLGRLKNKPPVTGNEVFLNIITTPYHLNLTSEPGREDLKHIIIDGSNVAMRHGLSQFFSCRGIALAVEYFWRNGHRKITAFVPQWRTKRSSNITEQHFLRQLEHLGIMSFTPSRMVLGTRIASHDDRLLQYTFAGDLFMIPDDPMGRDGPNLDDFLRDRPDNRQKFVPGNPIKESVPPLPAAPAPRSVYENLELKRDLSKIFPDSEQKIKQILCAHPYMRDLNSLSALVLD
uniref:NEDD4-binding protein 1 n=1 Tax=Leptobrachium leishanense TaxID=445787 RepID=A0A8C5R6R0_9ANUR